MSLPDPLPILKARLRALGLSSEERKAMEFTFRRVTELAVQAAKGEEVGESQHQVEAQVKLWAAGAASATQQAFESAAEDYAKALGAFLADVLKGGLGGLVP